MKILLLTILFPVLSLAAKLKSEGQVSFQSFDAGKAVKAQVKPGFHFNTESPAFAKSGDLKKDAKTRSEKEIVFELPDSKSGAYELRFYVCDDAKTVCEMHNQAWGKTDKTSKVEKELFRKDDLSAAFETAKKENKLVFIDFAGSWCPPCIRLEHEVFPTKEFKKSSAKYVLARVDVDLPANEKWMEKYGVKAFPTLVVTNAEGEELARKLDFQTSSALSSFLTLIAKETPLTQLELRRKAEAGDKKSQSALAAEYLKALNYVEALAWYDKAEDNKESMTAKHAEARIGFWEEQLNGAKKENEKEKARESLKLAYKESVLKFPKEFLAISWQKSFADLLEGDTAKPEYEKAKKMAMKWIEDPLNLKKNAPLELGDLTLPELWSQLSEIEEKIGTPEAVKFAQEKAISETLKLKPSEKTPTHVIYLVAYMKPVKELSEIEPWLVKLETAYPGEFTYFQRHAKLLLDKGEALKALPVAEKAYGMAFGSNQLNIGLLLAKIHKELQNKEQLRAILKDLKALPHFSTKRNQHGAQAILDFEKSLVK